MQDSEREQQEREKLENIANQFAKDFAAKPDHFVSEYRKRFDNYLCTDNALELCDVYKNAPKEQKAQMADALGHTASDIIRTTYDQMLQEPPSQGKENMVMFFAGGAGAGKTRAIEDVQSVQSLKEQCHIVYEVVGGLNESNINKALDAGKWAAVSYIHRPVEQAAASVLARGEQEGRVPSFDYVCEGHFNCQKAFLRLAAQYENHPSFSYVIHDNSRPNQKSELILSDNSLAFIKENAYLDIREVKQRALEGVKNDITEREKNGKPIGSALCEYYLRDLRTEDAKTAHRTSTDSERQSESSNREGSRESEARKTEQGIREQPVSKEAEQSHSSIYEYANNGEKTRVEVGVKPNNYGVVFFVREAPDNQGKDIDRPMLEAVARDIYTREQVLTKYNDAALLYHQNNETRQWDEYGLTRPSPSHKQGELDYFQRLPQYDIEARYEVSLSRTPTEHEIQIKADVRYMEGLQKAYQEEYRRTYKADPEWAKELFPPNTVERAEDLFERFEEYKRSLQKQNAAEPVAQKSENSPPLVRPDSENTKYKGEVQQNDQSVDLAQQKISFSKKSSKQETAAESLDARIEGIDEALRNPKPAQEMRTALNPEQQAQAQMYKQGMSRGSLFDFNEYARGNGLSEQEQNRMLYLRSEKEKLQQERAEHNPQEETHKRKPDPVRSR